MEESRYSRQVVFSPIGTAGQERLSEARIAIVGVGALGTVLATQLVRGGVGYVRLVDRDIVDVSNLGRQSLYDDRDASEGKPKAAIAAERLRLANPAVEIVSVVDDLTAQNAESLLTDVDVIVDGTDNFQTRYLLNDVAVKHGIAWSYGGAVSSYGTTTFIQPGRTPCLVCLFGPEQGTAGYDTCDTVGVIAPITNIIASFQVAEIIKFLTGHEEALSRALVQVDVWQNDFQTIALGGAKPECPCCGTRRFDSLSNGSGSMTLSLCGRHTVQVRPQVALDVSLADVAAKLQGVGRVNHTKDLLRFEVGAVTITLFRNGRALIHGVDDVAAARSVYARYIGI